MKIKDPCKECLVFPMCRSFVESYLKKFHIYPYHVAYYDLKQKCNLIRIPKGRGTIREIEKRMEDKFFKKDA